MARSRRSRNCGCGSNNNNNIGNEVDPGNNSFNGSMMNFSSSSNRNISRRRSFFPTNIKKLLILIAEDEGDNVVDIVLDACSNHCFIKDAEVIAVTDNTVIIREGCGCEGKFRFVCIDCICEVIVDCDTILEELFEEYSYNRE